MARLDPPDRGQGTATRSHTAGPPPGRGAGSGPGSRSAPPSSAAPPALPTGQPPPPTNSSANTPISAAPSAAAIALAPTRRRVAAGKRWGAGLHRPLVACERGHEPAAVGRRDEEGDRVAGRARVGDRRRGDRTRRRPWPDPERDDSRPKSDPGRGNAENLASELTPQGGARPADPSRAEPPVENCGVVAREPQADAASVPEPPRADRRPRLARRAWSGDDRRPAGRSGAVVAGRQNGEDDRGGEEARGARAAPPSARGPRGDRGARAAVPSLITSRARTWIVRNEHAVSFVTSTYGSDREGARAARPGAGSVTARLRRPCACSPASPAGNASEDLPPTATRWVRG